MRTIETQLVEYFPDNVFYSSARLLHMFAEYSDIPGADTWTRSMPELKTVIDKQEPTNIIWHGEGIDLFFSGFVEPNLRAIQGEDGQPQLAFLASEPYFAVREDPFRLLPSERTHYHEVASSIASEMEETYKMRVEKGSPVRMVFPRDVYARVVVFDSALDLAYLGRTNN